MSHVLTRFIHAFWLGSGAFLMFVAAPAAFRSAPNSGVAADVVGAMMMRWHYIALAAPLALLAIEWRRARVQVLVIVFIAVLFAAAQAMVDLRIRSIRASSSVPISELSRHDPVRRQFGMMHGISSLLLVAQVLCAGAALALDRDYRRAQVITPPELPSPRHPVHESDNPAPPEARGSV